MSQPFFQRLSRRQRGWVADQLRDETVGGGLLLLAAAIALLWANSPWADSYATLVDLEVGPASVGLNLSLGAWAADGLLSVFFLVVGLELKHELVVGSLSKPSRAAVPIAAALGGMVVPALLFAAVNSTMADGELAGWGIPMATDIAFALAVLAVIGRRLPVALRAFLLTLAVVDDLGAISVIAVFYSTHLELAWLSLAIICFVGYAIAQRRRVRSAWLYVPLALLAWYAMHESGVHATVTGVVLGLLTRVRPDAGEDSPPADRVANRLHPWSAALCVPIFAFFAAGVDLRSIGLGEALSAPVALGIMLGLVIGKPIGVVGTAWLVARFTRATLPKSIHWSDISAVGVLAGIGFTVSLLITELAFPGQPDTVAEAKTAVLAASVVAASLAAIALRLRRR
jgi:NhaA family Na+:H+ antiporter